MDPAPRRYRKRSAALAAGTALAAALAGGLAAVPAQAADGQIRKAGSASVVKDSYVVVLKDSAALRSRGVAATATGLTGTYSGTVGRVYSHALRGFEVSLGEAAAKRLAADPAVGYVQQNGVYSIQDTQANPPYGLDRIDQRALPLSASYTYTTTAPAVRAYVIDTGIRFSHSQFGGRASSGRDTVNNDNDASDCNGHGTHVAGTIGGSTYGVAKAVRLVGVRVLDCNGSGTTAGVVAGIDWVTANAVKPAVANMSLGGGIDGTLDTAVANSIASGITYAVAAGNGNAVGVGQPACNYSPARAPAALTVGATNSADARAGFSNYGTCVDLFAPGVDIASAWYTSDTATNTISGTSMATPHVAGAVALLLAANPAWTPAQVASSITSSATTGVVTNPGAGSPNRLLYTGSGGTTPPPGCTGTNGTDVTVPDNTTVFSTITLSCTGTASTASTVAVDIRHTYRGDLVVSLVAPDGSAYVLSNRTGGSADNIQQTFTVNLGSEARSGAWRLRVQDAATADTGYINTWTLTL